MAFLYNIIEFLKEMTLTDYGALAAIATATALLILWVLRLWCVRYPFSMRFFEKPWDTEDEINPKSKWKIVRCRRAEQKEILIGLKMRKQRTFETIDIRLLERHNLFWWRWKPGPKNDVRVLDIVDPEFQFAFEKRDEEDILKRSKNNKKGGREATYLDKVNSPRGDRRWYQVTLSSDINWNGYLSFQCSHKGIARLPLCFKIEDELETNS